MEVLPNLNQIDDEKNQIRLINMEEESRTSRKLDKQLSSSTNSSEKDHIPEIVDIYDYIHGNVQSKLKFYEKKVEDKQEEETKQPEEKINTSNNDNPINNQFDFKCVSNPLLSDDQQSNFDQNYSEKPTNGDDSTNNPIVHRNTIQDLKRSRSLSEHTSSNTFSGNSCTGKYMETSYTNDRIEVLTELNADLKLEIENLKNDLKKETAKNNHLNYEIANIENTLEMYYKEAKSQKSSFNSIYAAVKNYVSEQNNDDPDSYTYKRIKTIAEYIEKLKSKLEQQNKIIKNDFIENPYYTDLIIKHEAVLKQLDKMSKENQELKEELNIKTAESLEIIKEINRQKFEAEHKWKEIEEYYKKELVTKKDEYNKASENYKRMLKEKDEEMKKIQRNVQAKMDNYNREVEMLYNKMNERKEKF